MARITVEDCLPNVENIFQLVLLAAQRARRLANGAEPTVPWENDKPTVVALREIAEGNITPGDAARAGAAAAGSARCRTPTTSPCSVRRNSACKAIVTYRNKSTA